MGSMEKIMAKLDATDAVSEPTSATDEHTAEPRTAVPPESVQTAETAEATPTDTDSPAQSAQELPANVSDSATDFGVEPEVGESTPSQFEAGDAAENVAATTGPSDQLPDDDTFADAIAAAAAIAPEPDARVDSHAERSLDDALSADDAAGSDAGAGGASDLFTEPPGVEETAALDDMLATEGIPPSTPVADSGPEPPNGLGKAEIADSFGMPTDEELAAAAQAAFSSQEELNSKGVDAAPEVDLPNFDAAALEQIAFVGGKSSPPKQAAEPVADSPHAKNASTAPHAEPAAPRANAFTTEAPPKSPSSAGYNDTRTVEWTPSKIDPAVVAFHERYSGISEEYRSLRSRIHSLIPGPDHHVIAIASATPQEGKTVSVANLSLVMAEGGEQRVCMIDADMRRAGLARTLGLSGGPGLADVLSGKARIKDVLRPTPYPNLKLLSAGQVGNRSYGELLSGPHTRHVLAELRELFDYSIIDTPPINTVSDVSTFAPYCDGALMVVGMGRTPEANVQDAVRMLQTTNVRLLGCLLSRYTSRRRGHYYDNYYQRY